MAARVRLGLVDGREVGGGRARGVAGVHLEEEVQGRGEGGGGVGAGQPSRERPLFDPKGGLFRFERGKENIMRIRTRNEKRQVRVSRRFSGVLLS
jgi:hypothetical protein